MKSSWWSDVFFSAHVLSSSLHGQHTTTSTTSPWEHVTAETLRFRGRVWDNEDKVGLDTGQVSRTHSHQWLTTDRHLYEEQQSGKVVLPDSIKLQILSHSYPLFVWTVIQGHPFERDLGCQGRILEKDILEMGCLNFFKVTLYFELLFK